MPVSPWLRIDPPRSLGTYAQRHHASSRHRSLRLHRRRPRPAPARGAAIACAATAARQARVQVALDEFVEGDAILGAGLDRALDGVEVAYFLIHSMEGVGNGFADHERQAAEQFAAAAADAGVRRIVYLGGLVPADGQISRHLASRLAVEELLLAAAPESIAMRASIVIGARSRSFRFLVRLVERMPVLALPGVARPPHGSPSTAATCSPSSPAPRPRRGSSPAAPGTSRART